MSKTDPYFQFPLAMLQHAKTSPELIQSAIKFACLHYGKSIDETTRDCILSALEANYNDSDEDEMNYAVGADRLFVAQTNLTDSTLEAMRLHAKYGDSGLQVRLRRDIAWDVHNDNWPLPKTKVLCAIYAGIGDRQMRRMTRLLLRAHAAGFASPKGIKPSQMLSEKQVRYWADKLWMKNLFQMAANGHDLWYSNRFKNDTELAMVLKRKTAATKTKTVIQVGDI